MRAWTALLMALLLAAPALADTVIVNSQDWRDVYTGLQYAAVSGHQAHFATDPAQAANLAQRLDDDIILITGRDQVAPGLQAILQSRGLTVDEHVSRDPIATNEEFALRAATNNLIVIDDAFGYNAISVATYAKMGNASVVFSDTDVETLYQDKQPDELLLYGHIPASRYEQLQELDPVVINNQDRFEDNFEIVERYMSMVSRETLVLSNGEFIEQQLIFDDAPLLFMGRQNVPDEVLAFIEERGFRSAVLVGNALAPNANHIKEETGISIFVKFAQGRNEQQFALDLFDVPTPEPLITIAQAEYDSSRRSLLVTFQNPGEVATYVTASFDSPDGTIEDDSPHYIESGTYKTVQYEMAPPEDSIGYTLVYGASPRSLELLLQGTVEVERVSVSDNSQISIGEAIYDPRAEEFRVTVSNDGDVEAYVLLEASDVAVGAERVRVGSEVTRIASGEDEAIAIPLSLTERDISRNSDLFVEAFYGQRSFSLVNHERATLPVTIESSFLSPLWIVLAVAVALVLGWFATRRSRRGAIT